MSGDVTPPDLAPPEKETEHTAIAVEPAADTTPALLGASDPPAAEDPNDPEVMARAKRRYEQNLRALEEALAADVDARRRARGDAPGGRQEHEVSGLLPESQFGETPLLPRPGWRPTAEGERQLAEGKPAILFVVAPALEGRPFEQQVCATIPARYQGATWDTLADLVGPEELSTLGAVEREGDRELLRGAGAVRELRRRMARKKSVFVFRGESRAGKSVAAAAALEHELRRGARRACWAPAWRLKEAEVFRKALDAKDVCVVDNLGYELRNALPEDFRVSDRAGPAMEFFDAWYEEPGRRLIVTTWLTETELASFYGGGATVRILEGAEEIVFHRQ
jgi:hypothetical protein